MRVRLLAVPFVAFGCAQNGANPMVILGNIAPVGGTCSFSATSGQPTLSSGEIFAGSTLPYVLTPLLESRVTESGSGQATADRSIFLESANVTLSATATGGTGSTALGSGFSVPVSGTLPAGGTISISFPIIPVSDLASLNTGSAATEVVASVQVIGRLGGGEVKSEPFTYGITVCPAGAPCVVNDLGACSATTTTQNTGNPCNMFQDGSVDCCDGSAGLVCPAAAQ